MTTEYLLSIAEAGASLGRKARTLREWENRKTTGPKLPDHLLPARNAKNERRYSRELVEHIREWMIAEDLRTGKNIDEARALSRG